MGQGAEDHREGPAAAGRALADHAAEDGEHAVQNLSVPGLQSFQEPLSKEYILSYKYK